MTIGLSKTLLTQKAAVTSLSKYPSRQEIVDRMETIDVFDGIAPLTLWKDAYYDKKWKELSVPIKVEKLVQLAYRIYYEILPTKDVKVLYIKVADRYAFHPGTNTIIVDKNRASIISLLHEVGHAIFGESELEACAFSIKLFAKVFTKEYAKLEWHGHMLRLKPKK